MGQRVIAEWPESRKFPTPRHLVRRIDKNTLRVPDSGESPLGEAT